MKRIILSMALIMLAIPAHARDRFLAPEHLTRNRAYGIAKPSSGAQASSDVAADRADRQRHPYQARSLRPCYTNPATGRCEPAVFLTLRTNRPNADFTTHSIIDANIVTSSR
jgi:hypothetical protein